MYCRLLQQVPGCEEDVDLIQAIKVVFTEFGLPQKWVSDADTNFVSEEFKEFCRHLNIDQV